MTTGLNGPAVISSVVEYLRQEDLVLLLDNRGIPSVGTKQELVKRLQTALAKEICEWEWEQPENYHAGAVAIQLARSLRAIAKSIQLGNAGILRVCLL